MGKEQDMVERAEYQGKPVITLKRDADDRYPFSFGPAKAKLIVENIDEIRKFAAEQDGGGQPRRAETTS
jgi:hypothetical protein